jgi:hypothetical protein
VAMARPPTEAERAKSVAFIRSGPRGLEDFCQAIFSFNEFIYRQ